MAMAAFISPAKRSPASTAWSWITREQIQAIEVSVLWYSEGKGDEDLEVHEFWRCDAAERRSWPIPSGRNGLAPPCRRAP